MRCFVVFFVLIVAVSSCENVELEYSCDPALNQIVLENRSEFATIKLEEFTAYDLDLQKAIFNSWGADKKKNEWIAKLEFVISDVDFTLKESDHIRSLISHIDENCFETSSFSNNQYSSRFEEEWLSYAKNELEWTEKFIIFLVSRMYTQEHQLDAELSVLQEISRSMQSSSETCACSSVSDMCGEYSNCIKSSCSISSGCGMLWQYTCDGYCQ